MFFLLILFYSFIWVLKCYYSYYYFFERTKEIIYAVLIKIDIFLLNCMCV